MAIVLSHRGVEGIDQATGGVILLIEGHAANLKASHPGTAVLGERSCRRLTRGNGDSVPAPHTIYAECVTSTSLPALCNGVERIGDVPRPPRTLCVVETER